MREIGSEFPFDYINEYSNVVGIPGLMNGHLVFSGRTAIETVLKCEPNIRKALIPSYCCDSMIEPFRRAGIEIGFYGVYYNDGLIIDIDLNAETDCILWCNYFGFSVPVPDFSSCISRNTIIIEDITHSFFSKQYCSEQSHYLVASIRKWEPVLCGGYCLSRKESFGYLPTEAPLPEFIIKRKKAMELKKQYLEGNTDINKDTYMQMYSEANDLLQKSYSSKTIDDYSRRYIRNIDYTKHRLQRINNAEVLYDGLKDNKSINFMFEIEKMDCPLFVPVVIPKEKRDKIREKLINQKIYCPIHWPHPSEKCESNLYDIELSLICDQRYSEKDMKRIVDTVNTIVI